MMMLLALWLQATPPADLPVEQTKKNIKVLQGMPTSQLIPVMAFISNSLGVTCAHCHNPQAWDSDEKAPKKTAREMIVMQRKINELQFGGKVTVTCNTCHRGAVKPVPIPDLANAGWNARPAAVVESLVDADATRLTRVPPGATKRVVRGTVERYSGRDEPKSAPFTLTIADGKTEYKTELSHPPEAGRALAIYLFAPPSIDRLHGERWRMDGDNVTRRYRELPTPVGILPDAIDYSDYRDVGGVRLPFRAQWSRADYRVTYVIEEIASP